MSTPRPAARFASLFAAMAASAAALFAAAPASAGGLDVAIVAAASNTTMPENNTRFTDVRDKLVATGMFNSVSIFNATQFGPGTPTLEELMAWDAVIVWSNDSFDDAVALGNVLADYVDAGGGVVVSVFANTSLNVARFLQGRWQMGDYIAIPQNGNFTQGPGQMGTVLLPEHPIMQNVKSFVTRSGVTMDGMIFGGYKPIQMGVTPGSTKVALWNNGATLVALSPNPRVVELGFHPVSSDVNEFAYWDAATDGDLLMANALVYVAGGPPCTGDLDGDGVTGAADLAIVLGAWGTADPGADLDEDGTVGAGDLALLLGAWGPCA